MTVRVAVIDDDDITRCGTVAILAGQPGVEVIRAAGHEAEGPWEDIDVAIVDASDHRQMDDQFPGVAVVEAIRRTGDPTCTIIVVTGVLCDDVVRTRMREARADFYYHRSELTDASTLVDIVLGRGPRSPVPLPADPEALHRLGITRRTRVNAGIAAAYRHGLVSGSREVGNRGQVRTRRRAAFNEQARLTPVTSSGRPPDRPQDAPSLPQIDRFLRWATRTTTT